MAKRRAGAKKEAKTATVAALQRELRRAIRSSVARAKRELAGQRLYGVALLIHGSGTVSGMAFGTLEALEVEVDRYLQSGWKARKGRDRPALRGMLRWTGIDEGWWRLDLDDFEAAHELSYALVHGAVDCVEQEVEDLFGSRLGYVQLQAALAEADHAGLFGRGKDREAVVLLLHAGDQGDEELVEWARPMNPKVCVERLAADLRRGAKGVLRPRV